MSIYEYIANSEKSCEYCKDVFEEVQSILSEPLTECPKCGAPIIKLISSIGGIVFANRQMNTYNDVKHAKYWRDKNGIRHKVTAADGSSNSPTVPNRITASPEQIEERTKADKAATQKRLGRIRHKFVKRD